MAYTGQLGKEPLGAFLLGSASGSTSTFDVSFSDTLSFSESMLSSKITDISFDDTLVFTDMMFTVIAGDFTDSLAFTDEMTFLKISNRAWADALVFVEVLAVNKTVGRQMSDSLVFTESMTVTRAKYLEMSDTLVFTDRILGREIDVSFGDTLTFSESMSKMTVHTRVFSDLLVLDDSQSYTVNFSLQKFMEDTLEFKENMYVYKTRTGIYFRGLGLTLCLPSPEFNDFQMNQSKIVLHRAMDSSFRSYVKNTDRDKFNWRFILTKTQKDNLEYFVQQEVNNTIIVNDWEGRQWSFKLVNDAFDFNEIGRWERIGNKFEVTLEFEGVRYYG